MVTGYSNPASLLMAQWDTLYIRQMRLEQERLKKLDYALQVAKTLDKELDVLLEEPFVLHIDLPSKDKSEPTYSPAQQQEMLRAMRKDRLSGYKTTHWQDLKDLYATQR
jgi:DNA relaxase NicK